MIELCPTLGCHRPRGHAERTHRHVRFLITGVRGEELDAIHWPDHGDVVVIDKRDPNRRR